MKTVGVILHTARTTKGFSLEHVEKDTKIRKKFLEAIETDDFTKLPSLAYAKGFVKNYAEYLGIDSGSALAIFRRQTREVTRSSLLPKGISEPLNRSFFQLTPGRFLAILLGGLVSIFLIYFVYQYQTLRLPPHLSIDTPKASVASDQKRIDVTGSTDPDATITINGVSTIVRSDGKYFDQVTLESGKNTVTVVATSRYGKTTTQKRDVTFQP